MTEVRKCETTRAFEEVPYERPLYTLEFEYFLSGSLPSGAVACLQHALWRPEVLHGVAPIPPI
jgi:hypothetical protein